MMHGDLGEHGDSVSRAPNDWNWRLISERNVIAVTTAEYDLDTNMDLRLPYEEAVRIGEWLFRIANRAGAQPRPSVILTPAELQHHIETE
jgi:hypothetical protein